MHRHGYKGRKFGRENDQRTALTRGLMRSLFKYKSINTTLAKAKEIRRPAEKLITLAKKGDLASRRLVIHVHADGLPGAIGPDGKHNADQGHEQNDTAADQVDHRAVELGENTHSIAPFL